MSTVDRTFTGLLGTKLGMTQVWGEGNVLVPVTAIEVPVNVVTQIRTPEKDGYAAVQLGLGVKKAKNVPQPQRADFGKKNVEPKAHVTAFRLSADMLTDVGAELSADHFLAGCVVVGSSQGAGVVALHGHRVCHLEDAQHGFPSFFQRVALNGHVLMESTVRVQTSLLCVARGHSKNPHKY